MTLNEIKDLTRFLSEEEVEKIKKEIKSKEDILKSGSLDEEEMIQVLNTFFAILVIEKTLEKEIEGVEEIRGELEEELLEAYNFYDSYMEKTKKDEKKKKKRNLLNFLFLSDHIHSRKEGIGMSNKTINRLQNELNQLKAQTSDQNLKSVVNNRRDRSRFDKFCDTPHNCKHPHHHHRDPMMRERMNERRESIREARRQINEVAKKVERNIKKNIEKNTKTEYKNKTSIDSVIKEANKNANNSNTRYQLKSR